MLRYVLHVILPTKSCKINILEMLSIANHFISTCICQLLLRVFSQPNISLRSLELLRQRGKDHRALLNVLVFSAFYPHLASDSSIVTHCHTVRNHDRNDLQTVHGSVRTCISHSTREMGELPMVLIDCLCFPEVSRQGSSYVIKHSSSESN